ncbi:MAG TPA: hypothetical protein VHV30_13245 [Polyangiaceae bacterium]|jgi:hypothetical protein|nr:hypothetical protein [Polyangiaceae bacterium]
MPGKVLAIGAAAAGCAAAVCAAVGCASLLDIPGRAAEWCDRPENAHDFCDDFDHAGAGADWQQGIMPGAGAAFDAGGSSPPNAASMTTIAEPLGGKTVVGVFRQFQSENFGHVVVAADVNFAKAQLAIEAGVEAQLGYLLVEDQDFCIGLVLAGPNTMGIVYRAGTTDCTSVANLPADAGAIVDDGGLAAFAPVGPIPNAGTWVRVQLDIKSHADKSGTVGFTMTFPGVINPPPIPAGYLDPSGQPLVAIASSIVGPAGATEVLFDNVTVDFPKD